MGGSDSPGAPGTPTKGSTTQGAARRSVRSVAHPAGQEVCDLTVLTAELSDLLATVAGQQGDRDGPTAPVHDPPDRSGLLPPLQRRDGVLSRHGPILRHRASNEDSPPGADEGMIAGKNRCWRSVT